MKLSHSLSPAPPARQLTADVQLPEPNHPFSKWFGGACAAVWAVGVQSFSNPWSELLAILTPGIGYLAGHGLDLVLKQRADDEPKRQRVRARDQQIAEIKKSISIISKELTRARKNGGSTEVIKTYESLLKSAENKLVEVIKKFV